MLARVSIHPTQFPEAVRRALIESLRQRRINPKFHYDTLRQTQHWLAVHEACSPWKRDPDCAGVYERSFDAARRAADGRTFHLIGLGCGSGAKDAALASLLGGTEAVAAYFPVDVSVAMTLVARKTMSEILPPDRVHPLVCDLALMEDLPETLRSLAGDDSPRLITFFGMIPNFDADRILASLAGTCRDGDLLLVSANLAPGDDYAAGTASVLPQYDNPPTRRWLQILLDDLEINTASGRITFAAENCPESGLNRIAARFRFEKPCVIHVGQERFAFEAGEEMLLFFSYRHQPGPFLSLLSGHGFAADETFITPSGEEAVFLCRKCSDHD